MSNFTISEFHPTPKTLSKQEIDAILETVDCVLREFEAAYPTKGTLIIDGQARDRKAQCIVRLNLAEGAWRREFFRLYDRSSDDIATDSINNALSWPEKSRYRLSEKKPLHYGWLPSGIYRDGELEVLALNVAGGRFLAAFSAEFELSANACGEESSILIAIATAIALMRAEDKTLQHGVKHIWEQAEATLFGTETVDIVETLFRSCKSPALKVWQKWHESVS